MVKYICIKKHTYFNKNDIVLVEKRGKRGRGKEYILYDINKNYLLGLTKEKLNVYFIDLILNRELQLVKILDSHEVGK